MESLESFRYLALERIRQRAMNIPLAFHSCEAEAGCRGLPWWFLAHGTQGKWGSLPRPRFKLRVHLFKTFDDSRSLSSSQGTDRIDQLAARFECPCTCLKAFKLQGCQFLNVLGLGGPPCIGMPLPSAKTAARSVDQDAIKASFEGERRARFPASGLVIENLRSRRPPFEALQAPTRLIGGPDTAFSIQTVR